MSNATLEKIGEVFGVSAMSVSNALSYRKGISPAKAEAIRRYAENIGFRPAYMGKILGSKQTKLIGICIRSYLGDPWVSEIIHQLQDELRNRNLYASIVVADSGVESEKWALNFFNELRVEAVIIGPLLLKPYRDICDAFKGFPYVISFGSTTPLPIDHVKLNEFEGARMAVDYLYRQGHTKIGHVGIRLNQPLTQVQEKFSRHAGFCDTVHRHHLELREEWIINAESEDEGVAEAKLDTFLSSDLPKPTAWFFQSDTIATRCYNVFLKHKLRIPNDVSVIGLDNNPVGRIVSPPLTTIGYDLKKYVGTIVDLLIDGISSPNREEIHSFEAYPQLIERGSVSTENRS